VLTESGRGLEPIIFGLGEWGAQWLFGEPQPDELDAQLLVWWMHTRLDTSVLPEGRRVLQIRFTDDPQLFWILVERGEPSVCVVDPGFEVDVIITSDVGSLLEFWLGRLTLRDAMRSGRIAFTGPPALTRRMPALFELSEMAPIVLGTQRRT
jgi:hypothetical protein